MGLIRLTPTFVFVAINFFVLYYLLKKILFKPVTEFMENRTNSIKQSIDNAEREKAEALELKARYEEQLKSAGEQADKILAEARSKANREYEETVNAARKDAEAVLARAREEIDRERSQMIKDVKNQVATLALSAASKIIEANMDTESNRVLVDKFIDEAGAA